MKKIKELKISTVKIAELIGTTNYKVIRELMPFLSRIPAVLREDYDIEVEVIPETDIKIYYLPIEVALQIYKSRIVIKYILKRIEDECRCE